MIIQLNLQKESLGSVVMHQLEFSMHLMTVLYSRFGILMLAFESCINASRMVVLIMFAIGFYI